MGLKEREDKVVSAARLYVSTVRRLLHASMIEGEARARDGSVISRLHKVNARARVEAEATEAEALLVEAVERIARELAIAAGEKQKARVEAVWSALQGAGAVVEKPFVQLRVKK